MNTLVRQNSVTVLGDLFIEVSSRAGGVVFEALRRDALCYRTIRAEPGGAALNFALAAAEHFAQVNILGRVGSDVFGEMLLASSTAERVRWFVERSMDLPTGTTIYIRDSSTGVPKGVRLLVVDRGANRGIDSAYIQAHEAIISASDLFFLDGYSFLDEPRRTAAETAMRIARDSGARVALDLVPHDAHLYFQFQDVARWVRSADLLIVEVRTLRRVMGLESTDEVRDAAIALDTLELARRVFPGISFHLRFGIGNIENSLLGESGHRPVFRANGYTAASDTRGFGDRLSAADLADYVARNGTPPSGNSKS